MFKQNFIMLFVSVVLEIYSRFIFRQSLGTLCIEGKGSLLLFSSHFFLTGHVVLIKSVLGIGSELIRPTYTQIHLYWISKKTSMDSIIH